MAVENGQIREVLMGALDQFEKTRDDLPDECEITEEFLIVVGATQIQESDGSRRTVRHWNSTQHPDFVFGGLMLEVMAKLIGASNGDDA